ncbi:hypothetical protein HAV21_03560 [Paenarthrobacter sp. MSM-2-10-13]|uniref:phage distal tail protein n=1 Tax=Paenarthrobacter sp. MSM-2-10-13 TaxID=2717318 RepID=UPI0014225EE6|nr:phage tail domain-containing protein [Paenarthrobacter sp. MSM-2-10-13]NHW45975.1 hypothetical protein [Paenarthrobacter sp. MSM-2-10-13]
MKIWLNDYLLNDQSNRTYLKEPIEGLELPGIRTSDGQRSGQHGSYTGAQFYDARFLTLNGHIFAATIAEAKQKRREIQNALPLYPTPIVVRIEDDDGYVYVFNAQVRDFKMPLTQSNFKHIFKLELKADDPTIYDDTAGEALSATVYKAISGGMQFTTTSPQFGSSFYFTSGQTSASIVNDSAITVYPVIKITGKTTNPTLTNLATGQVWSLAGYSVAADSVTKIDMSPQGHAVTLNDGSVFSYVPLDAEWWGLIPGPNVIVFDSGSGSDVSTAEIFWRPGIMGI